MKMKQLILYATIVLFSSIVIFGCKSSKKVTSASETTPEEEASEKPVTEEVEAAPEKTPEEMSFEEELQGYFEEIARAENINLANRNISEVLSHFESGDVPVFIVFYREDGEKDYDKPTTIMKHLNYLKDQKKNPYKIDKIIYNDEGKIEELELTTR